MTAHSVSLQHLLTQRAVLGGSHGIGIVGNADAELIPEGIIFREDIVAQLLRLGSHFRIYFAQAYLFVLRQTDAVSFKSLKTLLQHHLLFACQFALVSLVQLGYTLVKPLVERDIVAVFRQQRDCLFHHRV